MVELHVKEMCTISIEYFISTTVLLYPVLNVFLFASQESGFTEVFGFL